MHVKSESCLAFTLYDVIVLFICIFISRLIIDRLNNAMLESTLSFGKAQI